jgi:hypothetical protein
LTVRLFLANSEELRDGGSNDFNSPVVEAVSFSFQAAKALSTHHNRNQIEAFGRLASRATIVGGDESSDSPIISAVQVPAMQDTVGEILRAVRGPAVPI